MGWGSKTTTNSTQTGTNSSSVTPIEAQWVDSLRQSFIPRLHTLLNEAQAPVFGAAQKAGYLNDLNELAGASTQKLKSQLSMTGGLGGGAFAGGLGEIESSRLGKLADFYMNLPFQERAAKQDALRGALGLGMDFTGRAPIGQNTTGSQSSTMESVQKTNPGLSGLVGGLMGIGLSGLTGGLAGIGSGIGFGKGTLGGITGGLYNPWGTQKAGKPGPSPWYD